MAAPPVVAPRADSFTPNLNLRKPEIGAARDVWGAGLNGDLDLLDAVFSPGGTGTAIGWRLGAGMTGDARLGTLLATADSFVLNDAADPTKKARIGLTRLPTALTQDYYLPALPDDLVGLVNAQHLSNKTTDDPPADDDTQALISAHYLKAAIAAAILANPAWETGDVKKTMRPTPSSGWLFLNGTTIGNATSGATTASATTEALFTLMWNTFSNTLCAVLPSGRGASAAADYAANKTLRLLDARGCVLAGADDMGGVARAILGTGPTGGIIGAATLGASGGEQKHVQTVAEIASHTHPTDGTTAPVGGAAGSFATGGSVYPYGAASVLPAGGGVAFNVVQPTLVVNVMVKL